MRREPITSTVGAGDCEVKVTDLSEAERQALREALIDLLVSRKNHATSISALR